MARLNIGLFGAFAVNLDGRAITHFESQKARALLAFLVVESGRPHCRDTLAGLLWPDEPDRVARDNLREALTNLRQVIGDRTAAPPFLLIVHDTIQFNTASDHSLDIEKFQSLLAACRGHAHRHPDACRSCAARLAAAVELYRGDFLAQMFVNSAPFEEWALLLRERLQAQVLDAAARLTSYHERRGEYDEAISTARRQLELEPWCEEAHRQAMRSLALSGQRSAALAQYARCRQTLAAELHAEPARATQSLCDQIRTGGLSEADASTTRSRLWKGLPIAATPLLGRERELGELEDLLENPACRLITITGPSGMGKTRLALEAGARQAGIFTHGVWFVPLADLDNPEYRPQAIATALGVVLSGQVEPALQLIRYLRDKEVLLILDSYEHLLPDPTSPATRPSLLSAILEAAAGVTLLVTSTRPLNLHAEWVFELGGLAYPSGSLPPDANWEDYGAVALFLHLARRASGHLTGAAPERAAMIHLCQAVEGMTLAIELAAAWSAAWPPQALAERIEQGLDPLVASPRDLPPRHRSLQAVFDHSWRLLEGDERAALARVAVFQGGCEEGAALQVTGAGAAVLRSLAAKSVLRRAPDGRWDMHPTLRPYAAGRLAEAGQDGDARGKHLGYFMALAESAASGLAGPDQVAWQARLEREHGNLRAALGWALDQGQAEAAARLCCGVWYFWSLGGHYSEGRRWLARVRAAAACAALPDVLFTEVLNVSGILAQYQGDLREAGAFCAESLALARRSGDQRGIYRALAVLSIVARALGELRQARAYLEEGLGIVKQAGTPWELAECGHFLGSVALQQEDFKTARAALNEGLILARQVGDPQIVIAMLRELGQLDLVQGRYEAGQARLAEGLALARALNRRHDIGWILAGSGWGFLVRGDHAAAGKAFTESLALCDALGDQWYVALNLLGLAGVCSRARLVAEGGRLYGASEALSEAIGVARTPFMQKLHARVHLGTGVQGLSRTFARARAEGRLMPLADAVTLGLTIAGMISAASGI